MLLSGESYTIGEILANDIQIQIPDMQRDYCWASTLSENNGKSLVENFIEDLIGQIDGDEKLQMGILYAYESPKNHVQLCDGQQRLTTIYLTLGVLYKLTRNKQIKTALVLPETDHIIPRFQYSIRESTLSFLIDLVKEILMCDGDIRLSASEIKGEDWYFGEYDNDPSIQNILGAIQFIAERLKRLQQEKINGLDMFTALLLSKIEFLYFDMVNRTYGEEQFVVLNTTGKPLTVTENIKPKLLGDFNDKNKTKDGKPELRFYADLWETWELHFWLQKHTTHQTADKGLNEFFRWVFIIEKTELFTSLKSGSEEYSEAQKTLSSYKYNLLDIDNDKVRLMLLIQDYFIALQVLESDIEVSRVYLFKNAPLSQLQCFNLLPLLSFIKEFNIESVSDINYVRLRKFLLSRAKDENVSKASITTAIETIRISRLLKKYNNSAILEYEHYKGSVSTTLLNKLEVFKFEILKNNIGARGEIETAFWKAEELKCTQGNIAFMFEVLKLDMEKPTYTFPLSDFNKLIELLELTYEHPTDLMRRALLTFGNYFKWNGKPTNMNVTRYSLGKKPNFFDSILNNGDQSRRLLLIEFLQKAMFDITDINETNLSAWYNTRISEFKPNENSIIERTKSVLIIDESFLNSMQNKLFCISDDDRSSYALYGRNITSKKSYKAIVVEDLID